MFFIDTGQVLLRCVVVLFWEEIVCEYIVMFESSNN